MKKLTAVLLALMLVVSFAACDKKTPEPATTPDTPSDTAPSNPSTPTPSATKLERGTWDGDVYTNSYMKFTLNLPEGWTISTDEELMALLDLGTEVLSEEMKKNYELAMEKAASFYDFAIADPATGTNLMFMFEDLSKTLGATAVKEEMYLDILKEQLVAVEQLGYKIIGVSEAKIAGESYKVLEVSAMEGVLFQKYFVKRVDKYMVAFIGTYSPDAASDFDALLASIEKM